MLGGEGGFVLLRDHQYLQYSHVFFKNFMLVFISQRRRSCSPKRYEALQRGKGVSENPDSKIFTIKIKISV